MDRSVQSALYNRLDCAPEQPALAFRDSDGLFRWRSVEQVYSQAASYATRLSGEGLRRDDVCILVLPSEELSANLLLASLLLGAVPLLVAPPTVRSPHSALLEILHRTIEKSGARVVVCAESMSNLRQAMEQRSPSTRFIFGEADLGIDSGPIPRIMPAADEVALLQLTSGTTGFPRICVWKQRSVLAALDGMAAAMKMSGDDRCLNWTPLYHDMGLVNNFLLCLARGVPLAMLSPVEFVRNPALWLRGLSETGSTVTWSPNFGFAITAQRVRETELEGVRLDSVRAFWNAAERIHLQTMQAFHTRFAPIGVRAAALKTNFGCAENVGGATFSDPDGAFVVEHISPAILQRRRIARPIAVSRTESKTVSVVGVGRAAPGITITILSPRGRLLSDGHIGEIALETPSRMAGYLGDAPATKRALHGKLLRTGDLGYLRGGELFWVGRVAERITVRGRKLDPSDFEPILLNIPALREGCFAAFGVDDERQGTQRVVIVSEVRDISRNGADISGEIRERALSHLGVTVDEVVLVPPGTLAKTSSGKRRHRHFRDLYAQGQLESIRLGKVADDAP
jgi:acyl-CoA synthetase (AMP-forming)/AMP-acid ligase II